MGNLCLHHAGRKSGSESHSDSPSIPGTISTQTQVCIHSQRCFMRKFLDIHSRLPSDQGPGRVLWGSPWAPVLEVTVYFGRKPRLGGIPLKHSAQREVIVFISARGLAGPGLGDGGSWRERKCEYVVGITWGRRATPPPPIGLVPSR